MAEKDVIECDQCGKTVEESEQPNTRTPQHWFRVVRLKMFYRAHDDGYSIHERNTVDLYNEDDPDFCSKVCAVDWFKDQLNKISKR